MSVDAYDLASATPPAAYSAVKLFGLPLPDIVSLVMLVYLIVLIVAKIVEVKRGGK